ncbi:MAG: DNA-binding protein [Deltaproteobacteria bacterium]|nr:MAG: DNA-binding protein [Deltaproteobacteria bacterium]
MSEESMAPEPGDPDRMTVAEVCGLLDRSHATIYRWIGEGMPSYKWGGERVFRRSEVLAWVNNRA